MDEESSKSQQTSVAHTDGATPEADLGTENDAFAVDMVVAEAEDGIGVSENTSGNVCLRFLVAISR